MKGAGSGTVGSERAGGGRRASRLRDRAARETAEKSRPPTGTEGVVGGTRPGPVRKCGDGQGIISPRMTRNFVASRGVRHVHVRSPPAGEPGASARSPGFEDVGACVATAPGKGAASPTRRGGAKARPKRRGGEAVKPPLKRHKLARLWSPKGLLVRIASKCGGLLGRATAMGWGGGKSLKPTKEVVVKIDN